MWFKCNMPIYKNFNVIQIGALQQGDEDMTPFKSRGTHYVLVLPPPPTLKSRGTS